MTLGWDRGVAQEQLPLTIMRVTVVLGVLLFTMGYGMGQASRKVITAQELHLTDRKGNTRLLLTVAPTSDTPVIKMLDGAGKQKLAVSLDPQGTVHLSGWPMTGVPAPIASSPTAIPSIVAPARAANIPSGAEDIVQTRVPASLKFIKLRPVNAPGYERVLANGGSELQCQVVASKTVANILIRANFYDSKGEFLDEDTAFLSSLSVSEVWNFTLKSERPSATVGKIVSIQAIE